MILITHDLGVVAGMTDRIVVMYAGRVFESAPTAELFARPGNPYTRGLLLSVPSPTLEAGKALYQIPGLPPDVAHLPPGCPFAPRCERVEDICRRAVAAVGRSGARPPLALSLRARSLCDAADGGCGMSAPLVSVRDLKVHFDVGRRSLFGWGSHAAS